MRLRTMIAFSAGYAYGAWRGRDRLVELADRARTLLESDLVQNYVERAQTGTGKLDRGTDVLEPEEPDAGEPEPEDDDFDEPDDELDQPELDDLDERDVEDEEASEPEASRREPRRARSGSAVRRRAPGRARR